MGGRSIRAGNWKGLLPYSLQGGRPDARVYRIVGQRTAPEAEDARHDARRVRLAQGPNRESTDIGSFKHSSDPKSTSRVYAPTSTSGGDYYSAIVEPWSVGLTTPTWRAERTDQDFAPGFNG